PSTPRKSGASSLCASASFFWDFPCFPDRQRYNVVLFVAKEGAPASWSCSLLTVPVSGLRISREEVPSTGSGVMRVRPRIKRIGRGLLAGLALLGYVCGASGLPLPRFSAVPEPVAKSENHRCPCGHAGFCVEESCCCAPHTKPTADVAADKVTRLR